MTFQLIKNLLDQYIDKNHPDIDMYGEKELEEITAKHGRDPPRYIKNRPFCLYERNIKIEREKFCKANPYNRNWLGEEEDNFKQKPTNKEEKEEEEKKIVRNRRTIRETLSGEEEKGSKIFKCRLTGCNRQYTSSFGLKYHMKEGHSEEKLSVHKPFVCPIEDCGRKYKNNNGLKYHLKNFHETE